jgi:hypothetical protein
VAGAGDEQPIKNSRAGSRVTRAHSMLPGGNNPGFIDGRVLSQQGSLKSIVTERREVDDRPIVARKGGRLDPGTPRQGPRSRARSSDR